MIRNALLIAVIALTVSGCAVIPFGTSTNKDRETSNEDDYSKQASFTLREDRVPDACAQQRITEPKQQTSVLVLLALSGGGSRAAYFSALSMLEMQKINLTIDEHESNVLHEVDAISSVSGGSMAAAYYAISTDPGTECAGQAGRTWDVDHDDEIRSLMTSNYRGKWIGNWFWPTNILAFWFSHYDRTDIMAQTLSDNLFDERPLGGDLDMGELNPLRPNLIMNATSGSRGEVNGIRFGQVFTFTTEDFDRICSSINDYSVARAVMASATFPGAFNFMTLKDLCPHDSDTGKKEARYLHVFDGGTADNLGLTSIKRVIWEALNDRDKNFPALKHKHVIVILVDAFTDSSGVDPSKPDPRGFFDFIMDTNVVDATSSLLEANRKSLLKEFEDGKIFEHSMTENGAKRESCEKFFYAATDKHYCAKSANYWASLDSKIGKKLTFVHLGFNDIGDVEGCKGDNGEPAPPDCLRQQLNNIATDFKFKRRKDPSTGLTDAEAIACGVPLLFGRVDQKACKGLVPAYSRALKRKWAKVKTILENTPIDPKQNTSPEGEEPQTPLPVEP